MTATENRWIAWSRSLFAVVVVGALAVLALANIVAYSRWHEVEDGVFWAARAEGVTAVDLAAASPAAAAGLQRGDVLLAVNGQPVQTPADVIEFQHKSHEGTTLNYTVLRLASQQAMQIALVPAPRGTSMYYPLAAVGLFTLLVGASVRLRRPGDQATLHFFWLCVAFFGVFSFSFTGPFDRLDWAFYWGDAIAFALLPPLLLHFTLVFPERPSSRAIRESALVPLIYAPAFALAVARVVAIARGSSGSLSGPLFTRSVELLDRLDPIYLFLCGAAALAALVRAFGQITSLTGRRQLRWIAWGTGLGVGPFAIGYALPWALGFNPALLRFTAVLLGLVPITFACAIVHYRLRDVEVIIKRGLAYAAFLGASGAMYAALLKLTGFIFRDDSDQHNWIVALLATMIVMLLARPVKEALQNALDRAFYRDRYDYRRALVAFARDLNSDLDVIRLSQRLVVRIVETLVLDRMALMLAPGEPGAGGGPDDFVAIGDYGFTERVPRLAQTSSMIPRLDAGHTIALDDPIAPARFMAEEVEFWRDAGIYYFVPCVFEGRAIAVLALGRKETDEPFNSEDLALLTAVAGQVATAIENGRLYRQLHLKAEELGRMREFNENILESIDDGLVVFDNDERIVRWNQVLESFYGVRRSDAVGCLLGEIFDAPFVEALRVARQDHPGGATLYRVPLSSHQGVDARLLVNATEVPLQHMSGADAPVGTLLLIEDVTDRVRLEEQLQISEKMASIGLLAAGVAHEVNTPLTGISSFTQMLLEGADPSDPRTALLEKIERQTFRAAKIVNGLLNLSRPGTASSERIEVDLNAVVTDVFSLLEHQFEAGNIKVRRELSAAAVLVSGIEHQLQQVFLNLFLNARDAMPRGGWLSVATRVEGGRAIAEISDTGSGIPSEQLARIYDPFFTTKVIGRGTGLGLSITYGIVREHDGTILCNSAVGQGTRFTLMLPLAVAEVRSIRR